MADGGNRAFQQRLDEEARTRPGRYRLRLAALAALGYGVVLGLLLLVLSPFVLVAVQLFVRGAALAPQHAYVLVLPAVIAVVVLRTLCVRFAPPEGRALGADEAPRLLAEIERLRRLTGAPPLAGVLVDADVNAKAVSVPRALGLLGHRHYLVLGLPLVRLLDREELAAVIAHEFGHFSAEDGGFAAWIHLSRGTWYRLRDGLCAQGLSVAWLLSRFYGWLAPHFDACSRALTRRHEYQADATAARAAGAEATGRALLRVEVAAQRLQARYWPALWARARTQPYPPAQLQAPLAQAMAGGAVDLARLLRLSARDRDPGDTHPTLAQRLDALGVQPDAAAAGAPAIDLLDGLDARLEASLDGAWRDGVRAHWQALHAAAAADRARLAALEGQAAPTPEALAEQALLAEQLRIDVDALPLYERALAADPARVLALFRAGLLQLRRGELEAGGARLRQAVQHDPGAAWPALEELDRILRDPDLDDARFAALEQLREALAAQAPAHAAPPGDDAPALLPHALDAAQRQHLARRLACEQRVARAWVVRRASGLREAPAEYLVLLDWRGSVAGEAAGLQALAEALGTRYALFTGAHQAALAKQVRAACGEPVYRRR